MRRHHVLLLMAALVPGGLAFAAVLGLGVLRQVHPAAIVAASAFLTFGPPWLAAAVRRERRAEALGPVLLFWSLGLLLVLPVYFPGERADAVTAGLSLLSGQPDSPDLARAVADVLPAEPVVATPVAAVATPVEPVTPEPLQLEADQIALPYEGRGRRLTVPVVFQNAGREVETYMMLDTGATYTTLPTSVLRQLQGLPGADAPELTLSTANGERTARVSLLDTVWLGDLAIEHVAITTCEDCQSDDTVGLLGLNVTGGFNLTIDGDRREVIFDRRAEHDRRLDLRPFVDLGSRLRRYPGGRVELAFHVLNTSGHPVASMGAEVRCGDQTWALDLGAMEPGANDPVRRSLPRHDDCEDYRVMLGHARW